MNAGSSVSTKRARANATVLAALGETLPGLCAAGDFNGLLRAQALAQVVAAQSEGDVHRKAVRIAKKAGAAAEDLNKAASAAHAARAKAEQSAFLAAAAATAVVEEAPSPTEEKAQVEEEGFSETGDAPPAPAALLEEAPPPAPAPLLVEAAQPEANGARVPAELVSGIDDPSRVAPAAPNGNGSSALIAAVEAPHEVAAPEPVRPASAPEALPEPVPVVVAPAPVHPAAGPPGPSEQLLFGRIAVLLKLLAETPDPPCGEVTLSTFAVTGDDGSVRIAFPQSLRRWAQPLLDGYERGRELPGKLILGVLRNQHRKQIKRELKQLAVDSMSAGADVRGLAKDAVPAIACALMLERLPTEIQAGSPEAEERVNDLLLGVLAGANALPSAESSPLFVDLFKLAVALGEAQRYADQLSITGLSIGQEQSALQRSRRRSILMAVAAGVGAILLAVAGFAIGAADNGGKSAGNSVTITQRAHPLTVTQGAKTVTQAAKTVTQDKVVTRPGRVATTTVIRTKHVPPTVVDQTKTVADVSTVTVTTTAPSTAQPATPKVVVKNVVPAGCASALAEARQMALLAVNGFSQFSNYAQLASEAIPAAMAHNAAKMAEISRQTQQLGNSLSQRAHEIARLGDAVSAASAQCR